VTVVTIFSVERSLSRTDSHPSIARLAGYAVLPVRRYPVSPMLALLRPNQMDVENSRPTERGGCPA
jgi:hypothetical protein